MLGITCISEKTSLIFKFNRLGTESFGPTEKHIENCKGMFRSVQLWLFRYFLECILQLANTIL